MRVATFVLIWSFGMVAWPVPASAHTAFESSVPADGAVLDRPVTTIVVTFTGLAETANDGFEVLTPAGVVVEPQVDTSDDGRTFTLVLPEPLFDGTVGVRWSVRAGDAHPISGAFSFTTTARPTTATPTDSMPTGAQVGPVSTADPVAPLQEPLVVPESPDEPGPAAGALRAPPAEVAESSSGLDPVPTAPTDLDSFLDHSESAAGSAVDVVAFTGRAVAISGVLTAAGAALLMATVANGELRALRDIRSFAVSAALAVVGSLLEVLGFVLDDAQDVLTGGTGLAIGLRFLGAVLMLAGTLGKATPVQIAGAACALGSFAFDGHTVTEGNRILTGLVNLVHVGAASVWLAGVALLVIIGVSRTSAIRAMFATFAVRFSVVAAIAAGLAGVAGIILTIVILDSPSELLVTAWGRTLIGKIVLVLVAGSIGGYNHFVLVPALGSPGGRAGQLLGRAVRVEVGVLLLVVVTTSLLVVAAT